jgi:hypothetical protein
VLIYFWWTWQNSQDVCGLLYGPVSVFIEKSSDKHYQEINMVCSHPAVYCIDNWVFFLRLKIAVSDGGKIPNCHYQEK